MHKTFSIPSLSIDNSEISTFFMEETTTSNLPFPTLTHMELLYVKLRMSGDVLVYGGKPHKDV